jgi:ADP-ribose pyrophosphatase
MDARGQYLEIARSRPDLFENPPGAAFHILLGASEMDQAEASMADRLRRNGAPAEWATVGVAFRDQYLLILRDAVRYADGSFGTYIREVGLDPRYVGVVILPVWHGKVLLIRHFRHATRRWHLEIPRGFGSADGAEESAMRELAEEIGASGIELTALGEIYPDTGAANGRVALFYAAVAAYDRPEALEGIDEILPTLVADFEQMIGQGQLDDGYLLAAYGRAKARGLI